MRMLVFLAATSFSLLIADSLIPVSQSTSTLPWFTGPLIAPPGSVVEAGHFTIESYVYVTVDTGLYGKDWSANSTPNFISINPQLFTLIGLTSWMDLQITPQFYYNNCESASSWRFGDLPVGVDFQLYSPDANTYVPGVKMTVRETIPTGHYQHLDPLKNKTDASGGGSWATLLGLVLYKEIEIAANHYMSATFSFSTTLSSPVSVHGFNNYGGGYGTDGKVYPGTLYQTILSFEFGLTKNWVFAIDTVYTHQNKTRFSGENGTTLFGIEASSAEPSSEQFAFAPAIEYNWDSSLGIIIGCYLTGFGRNATQFRALVANLVYNY